MFQCLFSYVSILSDIMLSVFVGLGNITKELMCAMRVHLMNETEMNVFCPAEAKVLMKKWITAYEIA